MNHTYLCHKTYIANCSRCCCCWYRCCGCGVHYRYCDNSSKLSVFLVVRLILIVIFILFMQQNYWNVLHCLRHSDETVQVFFNSSPCYHQNNKICCICAFVYSDFLLVYIFGCFCDYNLQGGPKKTGPFLKVYNFFHIMT